MQNSMLISNPLKKVISVGKIVGIMYFFTFKYCVQKFSAL